MIKYVSLSKSSHLYNYGIGPKIHLSQTDHKLIHSTNSPVSKSSKNKEFWKKRDKTQDRTGNLSNLSINVLPSDAAIEHIDDPSPQGGNGLIFKYQA